MTIWRGSETPIEEMMLSKALTFQKLYVGGGGKVICV